MAVATVTRNNDGQHLCICSCGHEGQPRADRNEAYRDRAKHLRTHDTTEGKASER